MRLDSGNGRAHASEGRTLGSRLFRFGLLGAISLLLVGYSFEATADQPAFPFPEDVAGRAAGNQNEPMIAAGDGVQLAVWVDQRSSFPNPDGGFASAGDIYAARIGEDGVVLDEIPLPVSTAGGEQSEPDAAWNGEAWLITWVSIVEGGYLYTWRIEGRRLTAAGEWLDDVQFVIHTFDGSDDAYFGLASNGQDWVVGYKDKVQSGMNTYSRLKVKGVTADGVVDVTAHQLYSTTCCWFFEGDIAYAAGRYLLVFHGFAFEGYGIQGMRITESLNNLDTYPQDIAASADFYRDPRVSSDGQQFLVSWAQASNYSSPGEPYVTRVDLNGNSLDGNGFSVAPGSNLPVGVFPRLEYNDNLWYVAWPDAGLKVARVDADGAVLDPGGVSFPGLNVQELAPRTGGGVQLVWTDSSPGGEQNDDIVGAYIGADLSSSSSEAVSFGFPTETRPDVVFGPSDLFLVYQSDLSGQRQIVAQFAEPVDDGERSDPIILAEGLAFTDPEVAFNGSVFLVVWADLQEHTLLGRRVDLDGAILDENPIEILDATQPDVAALGTEFLVVGATTGGSPSVQEPVAARVSGSDGSVLDPGGITLGGSYAWMPKVDVLVDRWLVVWQQDVSASDETSSIRAASVEADGSTTGAFLVRGNSGGVDENRNPAVACSGPRALIAWEDPREGSDNWNIYGRRLRADGLFLDDEDGFVLSSADKDQGRAALDWTGSQFFIAFEDLRNQTFMLDTRTDVFAARVHQQDGLLDPDGFAIEDSESAEIQPSVAGQADLAAVASAVFIPGSPYASYRIHIDMYDPALADVIGNRESGDPISSEAGGLRLAAFPNPARGPLTLQFELAEASDVAVRIYGINGRLVKQIANGHGAAGTYTVNWDLRDADENPLTPGAYFYRVQAGKAHEAGKILVLN